MHTRAAAAHGRTLRVAPVSHPPEAPQGCSSGQASCKATWPPESERMQLGTRSTEARSGNSRRRSCIATGMYVLGAKVPGHFILAVSASRGHYGMTCACKRSVTEAVCVSVATVLRTGGAASREHDVAVSRRGGVVGARSCRGRVFRATAPVDAGRLCNDERVNF